MELYRSSHPTWLRGLECVVLNSVRRDQCKASSRREVCTDQRVRRSVPRHLFYLGLGATPPTYPTFGSADFALGTRYSSRPTARTKRGAFAGSF